MAVGVGGSPTVIDPQVAAFGSTQLSQPLHEDRNASLSIRIVGRPALEHTDATHPVGLLRVRGARPDDCRAAKKGEEFAPPRVPLRTRPVQRLG